MRELEFLPSWYPRLRRRRRMVVIQGWATLMVVCGLGLWLYLADRNTERRMVDHSAFERQLDQSRADLKELNIQLNEKQKLEGEQRVMSKVGLHVEATRLLSKIDQIMPREMTLTDATFDVIEQAKPADAASGNMKITEVTRKLQVHLSGVTPSDADWAGVLAKLSSVPFFQEVGLVGAHDKIDNGHLMREFQIQFVVDLGTGG
ncbi:MAG TPA: PilN domain-containing protein [Tepidisphaeraceae bacterium]|jgi:Tfp pilus assembly protein PilN|nr:PilN domain-containing protein [Tepidisphaeraceae bacterium]